MVGFKKVDYVSKKTGKDVHAYELYCNREAPNVTGFEAQKFFIGDAYMGKYLPAVGDQIDIVFNQFGSVDSVEVC